MFSYKIENVSFFLSFLPADTQRALQKMTKISLKHLLYSVAWVYTIRICTKRQLSPWQNKVLH